LFIRLRSLSVQLSTISPALAQSLRRHGISPLNKIQNATVNVTHFAPFANTQAGTSVTVQNDWDLQVTSITGFNLTLIRLFLPYTAR